jgi:hypothetical protein
LYYDDGDDSEQGGYEMKTVHFNGEYWYEKDLTAWQRLKKWVANKPPSSWTPLSFFGGRVTFFGFGVDVSWGADGWLCVHLKGTHPDSIKDVIGRLQRDGMKAFCVFVSRNGTPWAAELWLHNPPEEVAIMARNREKPDPEGAARGSYGNRRYIPPIN